MMFEMWPKVDWTLSRLLAAFLSNHSGKLCKESQGQTLQKNGTMSISRGRSKRNLINTTLPWGAGVASHPKL